MMAGGVSVSHQDKLKNTHILIIKNNKIKIIDNIVLILDKSALPITALQALILGY
jgi:hypothetical protein